MKRNGVCGRRYFYPLITNFSTYCGLDSAQISNLPVANRIANSVICLPLHTGLTSIDVERIIELLKNDIFLFRKRIGKYRFSSIRHKCSDF